ncbi:hypothetical protein, partial [Celeribacter sp.]|uniref:hypothetical protein n=1 Tax=Celeribacter sp. TaxID=1890673 RepID=UPI003A8D1D08
MDKTLTERFDYSAAKWNRLSRSIKRVDDGTVEIRNPTNSVGKLIITLLILFQVGLFCTNVFLVSGERVFPKRPSSFDTVRQMIYEDYLWITDPDAYLEPRYQNYLEDWKDPKSIRSSFPLRSKEQYVEDFLSTFGSTKKNRFNDTLRRVGFGPFFVFLVLFLPLRILIPDSHGIRLDARRRVAYVRDWYGNSIKRFFGMADLR